MANSTPKSYSTDPTLWLYTSLSSGSSHIVTATSRLELILKANKIPFSALDVATDEKARMLWGRRAGKRKLPGLVRMGMVVADLDEVEEWNEYGEIQENLGDTPAAAAPTPSSSNTPSKPPTASTASPAVATAPASSAVPEAPAAPPMPESLPAVKTTQSAIPAVTTAEAASPKAKSPSESASKPQSPADQKTLATAMRDIHFEVAQKAMQAKLKSRTPSAATPAAASTSTAPAAEAEENVANLDSSGPTSMPPPTGEASSKEAAAPDTGTDMFESAADSVPEASRGTADKPPATDAKGPESPLTAPVPTSTTKESSSVDTIGPESPLAAPVPEASAPTNTKLEPPSSSTAAVSNTSLLYTAQEGITNRRDSNISMASKEEIKKVEEANMIPEEPEDVEDGAADDEHKVDEKLTERQFDPAAILTGAPEGKAEAEEEPAETKEKGQHIAFAGEAQGDEMARVKATLKHSSPLPIEPHPTEVKEEKEEPSKTNDAEETPAAAPGIEADALDPEAIKGEPVTKSTESEPDTEPATASSKLSENTPEKDETPAHIEPESSAEPPPPREHTPPPPSEPAGDDEYDPFNYTAPAIKVPATKTQDQKAADPSKAGESVAD